tara:strand:- start:8824 stop:9810 length:987 start_codon:yes stop_codon:yes gene_type:complete
MKKLLIILLSFGFGVVNAQTPDANVDISAKQIFIGNQVKITLILNTNAADQVEWPAITDTLLKNVEVLELSKIDTTFDKETITLKSYRQSITITSFDSGYYAIKPFVFIVNNEVVETEPILLEVRNIPIENLEQIRDIKKPIEVELSWLDYVKMHYQKVLIGLLILLVIFVLYKFLMREKTEVVVVEKAKPKIAPHIIALKKLYDLNGKKLWQKNKVKMYYTDLSEIVREYIENRFNVPALEQTTIEIISSIQHKSEINSDQKAALKDLLQLSDMVKFAKFKTLADENSKMYESALNFIEVTKQIEEIKAISSNSDVNVEHSNTSDNV